MQIYDLKATKTAELEEIKADLEKKISDPGYMPWQITILETELQQVNAELAKRRR